MAWVRADLDRLERAIASGTLSVRFEDSSKTYQSVREMILARETIRAEVEASEGKKPRRRTFRAYQSGRGL
jgi:hypothetical protein